MIRKARKPSFYLEKLIPKNVWGKRILIGLPYAWLSLFFVLPFLFTVLVSLAESLQASPPFSPLLSVVQGKAVILRLHFSNYLYLVQDKLYRLAFWYSFKLAGLSTLLCLIFAYPMAYYVARSSERAQKILLLLIILPFWTSFLLRVYAWVGILSPQGWLNSMLLNAGLCEAPLQLLHNDFSVALGMTYCYLPFMVLPLYASLSKFDFSLLEAAKDLGCSPAKAFWFITLPLTRQGIISGSILVFLPSFGEYVIPEVLGGTQTFMMGKAIGMEFFSNRDWPMASALAVALTCIMVVPTLYLQKNIDPLSEP